jgi:hypothetical protein
MMIFLTFLVLIILIVAKAYARQALDLKPIGHPLLLASALWYPPMLVVWAKA